MAELGAMRAQIGESTGRQLVMVKRNNKEER